MLKHRQYIYFYIFSRATLNKTFTAKYDGVLPRTPQVRPTSEIYTPKQDDEQPHPFHMRSTLPVLRSQTAPSPCKIARKGKLGRKKRPRYRALSIQPKRLVWIFGNFLSGEWNSRAFSQISKKEDNLAMYTQIFENVFSQKYSFPSTLSRNFKNFQI